MPADVDFVSLVEENRFNSNVTSPQQLVRERDHKKAYWNESISLRLFDNTSSEEQSAVWNIPRFRLNTSFLQETVNRNKSPTSPPLLVSHVHDPKTNTVILPKYLHQCRATAVYNVHVYEASTVKRGGVLEVANGESYYKGDLIFQIQNVPLLSKTELFQVIPQDIHLWFVHGAIANVEAIQVQSDKVEKTKQSLHQLERDIKNIHNKPIISEQGRAIVGSPLKEAREVKAERMKDEIKETKKILEKTQQTFEAAKARHFSACQLDITEHETNQTRKDGKISFSVKIEGTPKKKAYYENLVITHPNWSSVPMYATGDRSVKSKSKQKESESAMVLIAEADQVEHFVDAGVVRIEMLPDGFGVHETFAEVDSFKTGSNRSRRHRMYHGYFRNGEYLEGTLHSDAGVFSGTYCSNKPIKGTMKYSDGILVTGDFHKPHNGNVTVQFKDSSSYQGSISHCGIPRKGAYRYLKDQNM